MFVDKQPNAVEAATTIYVSTHSMYCKPNGDKQIQHNNGGEQSDGKYQATIIYAN